MIRDTIVAASKDLLEKMGFKDTDPETIHFNSEGNSDGLPAEEGEETKETKEETKEVAAAPKADELTDDEKKEAQNIYKGLRNPEYRQAFTKFLMDSTGISRAEAKEVVTAVKEETKVPEKSVIEILNEELGKEYEFMTPKLAEALNKVLEVKTKPLSDKLTATETELASQKAEKLAEVEGKAQADRADAEWLNIRTKFYGGEDIPKEVTTIMDTLMDEMPPPKGITVEKYLNVIHSAARGELADKTPGQKIAEKMNKPPAKGPKPSTGLPQIRSQAPASEIPNRDTTKALSARQAVELAAAQLEKSFSNIN